MKQSRHMAAHFRLQVINNILGVYIYLLKRINKYEKTVIENQKSPVRNDLVRSLKSKYAFLERMECQKTYHTIVPLRNSTKKLFTSSGIDKVTTVKCKFLCSGL
jgi:hypothetical protein